MLMRRGRVCPLGLVEKRRAVSRRGAADSTTGGDARYHGAEKRSCRGEHEGKEKNRYRVWV